MPVILDEGGSYAILLEGGGGDLLTESATPGLAWQAGRAGLPGDGNAVNYPTQVSQFLAAHAITPVYPGARIVTPGGTQSYGFGWVSLGSYDIDQPFAMPSGSTAIGRVTIPMYAAGNGADVTVSLCADSGGSPGAVIASTRVPGSWVAQLAAVGGLGTGGPLATAQSNTMVYGAAANTAWAQPAVSLNGVGNYSAPVTSGSYTILLGGYDSTAAAAVASVSTIAYLGAGVVSGPVPQPSLPQASWFGIAAATSDTVVYAGGVSGASVLSAVWTASWDPTSGTVGAWTAQTSLPAANVSGGMAAWGTNVYVVGGNTSDSSATSTADVWYASAVNAQIQSWTAGPSLPQAISSPYVAVVNGWLVVAGGVNSSGTALTSTWYSQIQANGTLGGWQAGPPLPIPAYAFGPGWNLAVTGDALSIVSGSTTSGVSISTQTLTVTADGPAAAWQSMSVYSTGTFQTAAYQGPGGQWQVVNLHLTSYDTIPLDPLPIISVPLPAAGLTPGDTYHLLLHQDGGDLNDYTAAGLDPSALPTAAQIRPNAGGSWSELAEGYAVIAGVWDQTPGGRLLHTWEDSGARITALVYASASGQLSGLCEATVFEDGTMLPAVTEVTYSPAGLPTGLVQLA